MKKAGIEGDFLSWDDVLHVDPVPEMHIAFKPATKRVCIRPPFRKYFL